MMVVYEAGWVERAEMPAFVHKCLCGGRGVLLIGLDGAIMRCERDGCSRPRVTVWNCSRASAVAAAQVLWNYLQIGHDGRKEGLCQEENLKPVDAAGTSC